MDKRGSAAGTWPPAFITPRMAMMLSKVAHPVRYPPGSRQRTPRSLVTSELVGACVHLSDTRATYPGSTAPRSGCCSARASNSSCADHPAGLGRRFRSIRSAGSGRRQVGTASNGSIWVRREQKPAGSGSAPPFVECWPGPTDRCCTRWSTNPSLETSCGAACPGGASGVEA